MANADGDRATVVPSWSVVQLQSSMLSARRALLEKAQAVVQHRHANRLAKHRSSPLISVTRGDQENDAENLVLKK